MQALGPERQSSPCLLLSLEEPPIPPACQTSQLSPGPAQIHLFHESFCDVAQPMVTIPFFQSLLHPSGRSIISSCHILLIITRKVSGNVPSLTVLEWEMRVRKLLGQSLLFAAEDNVAWGT